MTQGREPSTVPIRVMRELALLDEAEVSALKAIQIADRLDEKEISLSLTNVRAALSDAVKWLDDARICVRVDNNVPQNLSFRIVGSVAHSRSDFAEVWR